MNLEGLTVLCAASSYEQKFYLNDRFAALPDQIKQELQILCVMYTEEIGGVLTLDKGLVDMQDGKFELLLVRNPSDPVQMSESVRALLAHDYASDMLVMRQIRGAKITLTEENEWTLDGEFAQGSAVNEIEVLPGAVQLLVNL